MQVDEYIKLSVIFFIAFFVHSVIAWRAGEDHNILGAENKGRSAANLADGRARSGIVNVRIQINRGT
jgi:hypothetical protein